MDGYDLNDDGICIANCAAGYYVPTAGAPCTLIEERNPYYSAAHSVVYGETSGDNCKKCPEPAPDTPGGEIRVLSADNGTSEWVYNCLRYETHVRYTYDPDRLMCYNNECIAQQTTHGVISNPCYYTGGADGAAVYDNNVPAGGKGCVGSSKLISCDAGFWAPVRQFDASGATMPCQPVETGYYSPAGDLERYPCPDGTMTVGYGDGAASVTDCVSFRRMHVGDDVIPLMSRKYTTPSLNVQMPDGGRFYGYMIAGGRIGELNALLPAGQYSIISPLDQFERIHNPGYGRSPEFDVISVP